MMARARSRQPTLRKTKAKSAVRRPTVPKLPPDAPLAFVIMPFGVLFDQVYDRLFTPLLEGAGYRVRRADTLLHQRAILRDVVEGITDSDLIWADLTGGNPNVFYELGIAHGLRKRTILVAQKRDDIPFDLRGYKNYVYRVEFTSPPAFVDDLTAELKPLLVAARNDEVLFGSPFTDFADAAGPAEAAEGESDGWLDRILELRQRADEYGEALNEAGVLKERVHPILARGFHRSFEVGVNVLYEPCTTLHSVSYGQPNRSPEELQW